MPICDYLFIEPRHTWFLNDAASDSIMLVFFTILGVAISIVIQRLHRAKQISSQSALALAESEQKLRMIASVVPEILFTMTPEGENDYVNQRFSKYSGIASEALHGQGWLEPLHDSDRQRVLTSLSIAVQSGQDFETAFRLRRLDGLYRWFKCRAAPVRDSGGQISKWIGFCADIDDQKELERTLVERTDALLRSNEDLGRFASVAATIYRSPCARSVYSAGCWSTGIGETQTKIEEFATYIGDAVARMQNLIHDLLSYAQTSRTEPEPEAPTDMNVALGLALTHLQSVVAEAGPKYTLSRCL